MRRQLTYNQAGFSAIELIFVLIVFIVLGLVGCILYRGHHQNPTVGALTTKTSIPVTPGSNCNPNTVPKISYLPTTSTVPEMFPDGKISYAITTSWTVQPTDTTLIPQSEGGTLSATEPAITVQSPDQTGICIHNDNCGIECNDAPWTIQKFTDVNFHIDRNSALGTANIMQWSEIPHNTAPEGNVLTTFAGQGAWCPVDNDVGANSGVPANTPTSIPAGIFIDRGCQIWYENNIYDIYEDADFNATNKNDLRMFNMLESVKFLP